MEVQATPLEFPCIRHPPTLLVKLRHNIHVKCELWRNINSTSTHNLGGMHTTKGMQEGNLNHWKWKDGNGKKYIVKLGQLSGLGNGTAGLIKGSAQIVTHHSREMPTEDLDGIGSAV